MKKIVAVVVVILTVVLVVGPLWGARQSQHSLDAFVQHLNQTSGYQAQWRTYNRGWLRSRAVLEVRMEQWPDWLGDAGTLPWVVDIHHGPLMVTHGMRPGWFAAIISLDAEREQWLESMVQVEQPGSLLESRVTMDLAGRVSLKDRVLPFSIEEGGTSIRVGGYRGEGSLSALRHLHYAGVLPAVAIHQSDNLRFKVDQTEFVVDSDLSEIHGRNFAPGEFLFSIGSIVVDDYAGEPVRLEGMSASTSVVFNEERTLADMNVKAQFDSFILEDTDIRKAQLHIGLERMSLVFLEEYLAALDTSTLAGQPPSPLLRFRLLSLAVAEWVPHGPSINIERLSFDSNYGVLDFNAHLTVDPAAAQERNPMALVQYLELDSELILGKELAYELVATSTRNDLREQEFTTGEFLSDEAFEQAVQEQTRMKLDMLLIQGMLKEQDHTYYSQFEFKNGRALLNGQSIPLPF